ncbi:MAG TPA: cyclase family protein [Frankiaceae bacterium]|jgi:kynurenine formamidase|nr:cyclase family protein [Frankiaceae bacterium]
MTTTAPKAQTGNWGRWGDADERGALNLLTPEVVLRATQMCRTGKVYNLGLPVQRSGVPVFDYRGAPMRLTLTSQTDEANFAVYGAPSGLGANEDTLVIPAHNGTHVDALCHVYSDGEMYNGFSKDSFTSQGGAGHCGIEKTGGFAAHAVLADLAGHMGVECLEPGYRISGTEIEACLAAQGVSVQQGDALLVRTGWLDLFDRLAAAGEPAPFAQPGLSLSCVDFIRDNQLAAVGADNAAIECIPFDDDRFLAVHIELLVKLGIPLVEHLQLGPMAADKCYSALFVVAPMLVTGGTGSPVNPIAIG